MNMYSIRLEQMNYFSDMGAHKQGRDVVIMYSDDVGSSLE